MTKEILIIDDNLDIRQLVSGILIDQGFRVREAANYDQALLEINKKLPDVAIIDVKLDKGDNDGIELLERLKKIDDEVPVIMISGHANVQMAIDSLKLGAFEFIQKPFSTERLLNFLNRAIENVDLKKEKRVLENKLFHSYEIIGKSQTIEKVKSLINKLKHHHQKINMTKKIIYQMKYYLLVQVIILLQMSINLVKVQYILKVLFLKLSLNQLTKI